MLVSTETYPVSAFASSDCSRFFPLSQMLVAVEMLKALVIQQMQ